MFRQFFSIKPIKYFFLCFPLLSLTLKTHAEELNLSLKCKGSGTVNATETTFKNSRNKSEHSREFGTEQAMVKRPFEGVMLVEIHSDKGQVKIPVGMLPPFQKDEASDWFPIHDYKLTSTDVTGEVKINFLNKPSIRIDRTTGTIVFASGLNEFSGECEKVDPDAKPLF